MQSMKLQPCSPKFRSFKKVTMADKTKPIDSSTQGNPFFTHNLLMNAISSGSLQSVIQHINYEPELVTTVGWNRQTALHRACLVGNLDIVKHLINLGADPNARNNFDETPLHYACKRGLPPVLRCLLDGGGDVTLKDKMSRGAVHHAAEGGSVHLLGMLECCFPDLPLNQPDANLQTPLHLAVKGGKMEAFKYLIKKERSNLKWPDKDGNWPLHISAQEGFGTMMWMLLCVQGLSALHVANKHGFTPCQLVNMYDTPRHKMLAAEVIWQSKQSEGSSPKQRAYLLWFCHLLQPMVMFSAAVITTRLMSTYHILVFLPLVVFLANTVKSSYHRMNHVSSWPNPSHAGAFAAGIFHTLLVYFYEIMPVVGTNPLLKLSSFVMAVLLVGMYIKLLMKDPGYCTSPAQDEVTGKQLTLLDVCSSDKWTSFCADCEMVMGPTTKHCKLCERCMLGMDHHCLFLLRCVASGNHTLFMYFMMLVGLCMVLFIYACGLYIYQLYRLLPWLEIILAILDEEAWALTLFLLNLCSVIWVGTLLSYQCNVISFGHTQYFRPKHLRSSLSCDQRIMNIVYFLLNRGPYVRNDSADYRAGFQNV